MQLTVFCCQYSTSTYDRNYEIDRFWFVIVIAQKKRKKSSINLWVKIKEYWNQLEKKSKNSLFLCFYLILFSEMYNEFFVFSYFFPFFLPFFAWRTITLNNSSKMRRWFYRNLPWLTANNGYLVQHEIVLATLFYQSWPFPSSPDATRPSPLHYITPRKIA